MAKEIDCQGLNRLEVIGNARLFNLMTRPALEIGMGVGVMFMFKD